MSMDKCYRCDNLVDTDFDLECYDLNDRCICESCRGNEESAFMQQADDQFDQQKGLTDECHK